MPPRSNATAAAADGRALNARGRRTRARLLDAGADAFAKKGYHAARVDDIVAAAETSHGTFYLYFESKEALFDELVSGVAAELATLVDALPSVRNNDQGRAALREWLTSFTELYEQYGSVIRT